MRPTPALIAGLYLVFAAGAVYVSEVLLPAVVGSAPLLARLQLGTAVLETAVTAGLLYVLTARSWRSVRETNADLDAARQGLDLLHRILRHDLRNDITLVAGHADTIRESVDRPPLADHCDAISDSCRDILGYTEKAKLIADLDREELEIAEIDLAATVARIDERLRSAGVTVDLETSIPDGATVLAHEYLEFAVVEAVENAVVHHDGDVPSVHVRAHESPEYAGWVELCVEDDGPGIPTEEIDPLGRGEEPLAHGSGVGLWMASWIVYRSGGDFAVEATDDGTRVRIILPTSTTTSTARAESALERFLA